LVGFAHYYRKFGAEQDGDEGELCGRLHRDRDCRVMDGSLAVLDCRLEWWCGLRASFLPL
jgi:hypothetical protein